jgi:hypothetical protein
MSRSGRTFLIWFLIVVALGLVANLPRDGGALKPFLEWAGFPLPFAFWQYGTLEWFDGVALAADVGMWAAVAAALAGACAWARHRRRPGRSV